MVTKGDGDVETMQEQRGACTVERGKTGDVMTVTGVRGRWGQRWNKSGQMPSVVSGVECSILELIQMPTPTLPHFPTPTPVDALTLGKMLRAMFGPLALMQPVAR